MAMSTADPEWGTSRKQDYEVGHWSTAQRSKKEHLGAMLRRQNNDKEGYREKN
jgi:hypothetical protein